MTSKERRRALFGGGSQRSRGERSATAQDPEVPPPEQLPDYPVDDRLTPVSYAVTTASRTLARAGSGDWRIQLQAPDWSLHAPSQQARMAVWRAVTAWVLGALAIVLALAIFYAGPEGGESTGATPLPTPTASVTGPPGQGTAPPSPSGTTGLSPGAVAGGTGAAGAQAPSVLQSPEAAATQTPSAAAAAPAETSPASDDSDLDLARIVALGVLALAATLGAVALVGPRRDLVTLTVTAGAAARSASASTGTSAGPGAAAGESSSPTSSADPARDSSLTAREPVVAQGLVTAVLLAAGVLGINNTSGLEENLLNIAVPLVPLLGAFFARGRVKPLPKQTTST